MNSYRARPLLCTALFLLTLAVLATGDRVVAKGRQPTGITLGAIYNLSGNQSSLDIQSANGAKLAVAERNELGGLLGEAVLLAVQNGKSRPPVVAAKTRVLLRQNPAMGAIFGLSDTDMVLAAGLVAADAGRLFITSGATSPHLPDQVQDYLYLACFGDNVQAAAGAEWAYEALMARTVAVMFNADETYTQLLHGYFETRFRELGGTVVSVAPYDPANPAAAVPAPGTADLVFLSAAPAEAVAAARAIRDAGVLVPILGGDGLDVGVDAWATVPGISDVYFTTHAWLGADSPDPEVLAFRAAYLAAYDGMEPDAFAALGYDTANLLMTAIGQAGSTDTAAIRSALSGMGPFEGISGTIRYENGSRIPRKSVTIIAVQGGVEAFIEERLPDSVPEP